MKADQSFAALRLQKMSSARSNLKNLTILNKKTQSLLQKYQSTKVKEEEQCFSIKAEKTQSNRMKDKYEQNDKFSLSCLSIEELMTKSQQQNKYKKLKTESKLKLTSFQDKYQLLQKLGQGGNGCVYKCIHKKSSKIYAAKKFRIQQEHLVQLKRNFISMRELNHKSICKYRALHFQGRTAYLVMDYLSYPSLAQKNKYDQATLQIISQQITSAIAYIHSKNICHRDLKPENILFDQHQGKIKIIDFGISKKTYQRGARRDMLTIIGTHLYQAPQVYNGGGYDERIDLWAFGVTLFKLVTGYTPFESQYHSDTITNILKGQVKFQDKVWKKYSDFAKDFIKQLLKPRQKRMTPKQAKKHLWMKTNLMPFVKFKRSHSGFIEINEQFHDEINTKQKNALSKQQGDHELKKVIYSPQEVDDDNSYKITLTKQSLNIEDQNKKLYKNVNMIERQEYDLQDSDDEDHIVSPSYNYSQNVQERRKRSVSFSQFIDTSKFLW